MADDAFDCDLFVIGAGSGGTRAGRLAAAAGWRVIVAEESRTGGTCVIRGCVPKKLFVYASEYADSFEDAAGFGWQVPEPRFDWPTLVAAKDREISRLEGLYRKGLENAGARVVHDRAVLTGPHEVRFVGSGEVVRARHILLATGGRPRRPAGLPGAELAIVSDDAFDLAALPDRILIEGGGYIGVEFACIFAGLGVEVTLVARSAGILRGFDGELARELSEAMVRRGIAIHTGRSLTAIEPLASGARSVRFNDGTGGEWPLVMLATGRDPNTNGLGLKAAGVETLPGGAVKVDAFSRTSVPHIFAVGDVTDRVALTPVAIHEAMCLIETIVHGRPTRPDHELIPTAVFSQPELGTVGLTEEEAISRHEQVDVYRARFRPLRHTLSGRDEPTLMKILVDADSNLVLGVQLLGHGSGEIAQAVAIACRMGARKADFDRTMALHPSAAEELVTLYKPSYRVVRGERQAA